MIRCFADPSGWKDDKIVLSPDATHHLLHVLRASVGDAVTAFDGLGRVAAARLANVSGRNAELEIKEQEGQGKPAVSVTLLIALVREQKMDMIVQKATELGVGRIVPVAAGRCVVKLSPAAADSRRDRWGKIALNAARQSGVSWIPEIAPVRPLAEALKECSSLDALLVCSLEPDAAPIRATLKKALAGKPKAVGILIGPEGDLAPAEVAMAKSSGAIAVSLGETILRVETAALYALSVIKYELEPDCRHEEE